MVCLAGLRMIKNLYFKFDDEPEDIIIDLENDKYEYDFTNGDFIFLNGGGIPGSCIEIENLSNFEIAVALLQEEY